MEEKIREIRHDLGSVASAIYLLRDGMGADEAVPESLKNLANMSAERIELLVSKLDAYLDENTK